MNCTVCNTPLEPNARFCRKCGEPISFAASPQSPNQQQEPATKLPGQVHLPPPSPQPSTAPAWSQQPPTQAWNPQLPPTQPTPYQPHTSYQPSAPNAGTSMQKRADTAKPRRRRFGCLARTLVSLVLLIAILAGAWFAVIRPYARDMAISQLDTMLADAVNQIPPAVIAAPAGSLPVKEQVFNNILVLESSPNDLVKNAVVHITPTEMRLDFQIYGISSTITGVPQVQQNKLVMTNMTVAGLASLILTSDDIQPVVNRHLADAQQKLNHPVLSVQLKEQEMDLQLGPPSVGVPTLP